MRLKYLVTSVVLSLSLQAYAACKEPSADSVLIDWMVQNGANPKEAPVILRKAREYATSSGVDYLLLLSIMRHESNFRKASVSRAGSLGLMQVHEKSHPSKIKKGYLHDISAQINTGTEVYVEIRDKAKNDRAALRRYSNNRPGYDEDILKTRWRLKVMIGKA